MASSLSSPSVPAAAHALATMALAPPPPPPPPTPASPASSSSGTDDEPFYSWAVPALEARTALVHGHRLATTVNVEIDRRFGSLLNTTHAMRPGTYRRRDVVTGKRTWHTLHAWLKQFAVVNWHEAGHLRRGHHMALVGRWYKKALRVVDHAVQRGRRFDVDDVGRVSMDVDVDVDDKRKTVHVHVYAPQGLSALHEIVLDATSGVAW
jgi:hypothetical protein